MDDDKTLQQLDELAERLGMKIRYEPLNIEGSVHIGGFCRVKGQDLKCYGSALNNGHVWQEYCCERNT